MGDYEKLLSRILERFPDLSREEVEAMVEAKLSEFPLLNRVGALLLVAEELGAFTASEAPRESYTSMSYTRIADLVPGLNDVSVRGTIYAIHGPLQVKGHRILRIKLGDESGVVEATLWDERAEEAGKLGLKPGDQVAILHAYTRERIETGKPELRIGRNGQVVKLEAEPGAPAPEGFFLELSEALERGEGVHDLAATIVEVGEERRVQTQFGEAVLREVIVTDGSREARLTAWREKAELLRNLKPGEKIYLTDVRLRRGRLTLTSRSILAMREKPTPETLQILEERRVGEKLLRVLDLVERSSGWAIVSTDGEKILRVLVPEKPELASGDYFKVREAVQEVRGERVYLIARSEVENVASPEREIPLPKRVVKPSEILREGIRDERDLIVEGILYTKTQVVNVETKFGTAERLGFWLKDEEAAVQGVAWRSKAAELSEIPEGARIRLKWVSVRMNPFGEPEIHLETDSVIEQI